jgi:polar amino acid transport system substrate-binding protein
VYGPHLALFNDLGAGGLDAVVFDSVYVRWRVMRDGAFRVVGEPLNRLAYHVGVRREDAALLSRVNSAIRDLRASAEMAQIRRHWEGR